MTKPSLAPLSQARWLAFQPWTTPPWFWQRSGAWYARTGLPAASGFESSGRPSEPTRNPSPLTRLAGGELSLSELATPFPMSLTAVSKHVKVLEEARLVSRRRRGRESRCRLEPGPLSEAWEWIDHYRRFWEARLESLDRYFES